MEDYLVTITNDLKQTNKSLSRENDNLRQEVIKLKEYIKLLENSDYVRELESTITTLQTKLATEQESYQKLKNDVEILGARLDDFLALFANHIDNEENRDYEISDDKSLLFGVNLDSHFIQNASSKAIKNYLYVLKCNQIQNFEISDFSTIKESELHLIGEVFADYIRLSHLANNSHIYGLIEMSIPNIFEQNTITIKFYGNKNIENDFVKFKKIYSKELKLENSILLNE